jgi:hypothetical protein
LRTLRILGGLGVFFNSDFNARDAKVTRSARRIFSLRTLRILGGLGVFLILILTQGTQRLREARGDFFHCELSGFLANLAFFEF